MKLAIDLTCLYTFFDGGKDQVIFNLLKGFRELGYEKDILLFAYDFSERQIKEVIPGADVILFKRRKIRKVIQDVYIRTFLFPYYIKKMEIDLLFFPKVNTGFRNYNIPTVVLPHDIGFKSSKNRLTIIERLKGILFYNTAFRLRDIIIAISDYDLKEIRMHYPQHTKKVRRIYNPVDFNRSVEETRCPMGISTPYLMTINFLYPHKNAITLLKAFQTLLVEIPHTLLLVGRYDKTDLLEYVQQNRMQDRVIFTGKVTDSDLVALLKNCSLYVNPSLFEGFGITPIEAMGMQIPVLSSLEAALWETTQGLARYYEPANSYEELSKQILQVLRNPPNIEELIRNRIAMEKSYLYVTIAQEYWSMFRLLCEKASMECPKSGVFRRKENGEKGETILK